ncbi:MAG: DUF1521 domain-containing protein [Blastocatellia bacterium]|nr:DUF1521 domain-containing protein [Blastocatellia bacterium]MBN8723583.1 DUF1521 domain-containing protein [Acidobacteriota bacterium]
MAFGQVNNTMAGDPWRNEINNIRGCWQKRGAEETNVSAEVGKLLESVGSLLESIGDLVAQLQSQPPQSCQPAPVQPPKVENSCHPAGNLKSENGVITTPGGYKIEPVGQFDWNITGPDGHKTEVWGDPHVRLDGKEVFDFKRDTTFVLGDGTRINVTTAPWGKDMTVSKQLEIISGNDRVLVTDIDKGKGKIGQVTPDGFANVNNFGNKDVIVMGRNTAQWTFKGKEIVGSVNGGESFKLGQDIAPLVQTTQKFGGGQQWAKAIFDALGKMFDTMGDILEKSKPNPFAQKRSKNDLGKSLEAIGEIFVALAKIMNLSNQISLGRFNQNLN